MAEDSGKPPPDPATASREELVTAIERLQIHADRQVLLQQELITARDRLDQELMRFRALADYMVRALEIDAPEELRTVTLEALIEAFEFEVALFLVVDCDRELRLLEHFGFEESPPPLVLPWDPTWAPANAIICRKGHPLLEAWASLELCEAIVCAYRDRNAAVTGIIVGGITRENEEVYRPIGDEMRGSYRLIVEQAGALQARQLLTQQMAALTQSYSRFVPFEFLDLLGRESIQDIDVGDQTGLEMSVLFADLRGFTTLSEALPSDQVFALLNAYLAAMEPPISAEQGFVNQYQGDAIMALFHTGPDAALRAAIGMCRALDMFNATRAEQGDAALEIGIGIHSGPLMLGAIGGARRLECNVVGDTANLASRTEGMTKFYGARLLITESSRASLDRPGDRALRELDLVVVKGRREPIAIYEVLDVDAADLRRKKIGYQARFAEALGLYRKGEFQQARLAFMACMLEAPDDGAVNLYVDRCGELARRPPYAWAGVTTLDDK